MNPEDFTTTELIEQVVDLGLLDEDEATELSYWDLQALLGEYDAELAAADFYAY